jgi:hypothetical protein
MEEVIRNQIQTQNPCFYSHHRFRLKHAHDTKSLSLTGLLPCLEEYVFSDTRPSCIPPPYVSTGATRIRIRPTPPRVLGKRVDRELHRVCQSLQPAPHWKKRVRFKSRYRRGSSQRPSSVSSSPRLHLHTRVYLQYWASQGAVLLASQVPVACRIKRMGTAVDQVLYQPRTRELFLVELKNSCLDLQPNKGTSMFKPPFHDVVDSTLQRFLCQAACNVLLFQETFPALATVVTMTPILLVLNQKTQQVSRHHVPASLLTRLKAWLEIPRPKRKRNPTRR